MTSRWIGPALVTTLLIATGCAGPAADRQQPDQIILAEGQELGGYSPFVSYGELAVSPIYEGLLRPQADSDAQIPDLVPALAASAPEPVAPRRWRVALRDGVTFSDGSSLDSADVVATYAALKNPAVASDIATNVAPVTAVIADGPQAVIVEVNTDTDPSPYLLTGIVPSERGTGRPGCGLDPEHRTGGHRSLPAGQPASRSGGTGGPR